MTFPLRETVDHGVVWMVKNPGSSSGFGGGGGGGGGGVAVFGGVVGFGGVAWPPPCPTGFVVGGVGSFALVVPVGSPVGGVPGVSPVPVPGGGVTFTPPLC